MSWNREFISQDFGRPIYKHQSLPIYETDEFDFFRCLEFKDKYYGKTVSCLFNGNLRECDGRYSSLFPGQKISYWADSPKTALAEIKKHGAGNDVLTFWAYDDGTSSFPMLEKRELLRIIDGRKCGIEELIDKVDNGHELSSGEKKMMANIMAEQPDCLVFDSHAYQNGEIFIFLEKGFKKLSLRQLSLRFGRCHGGNHNKIKCAYTSDYSPCLENYGMCFYPKAKIIMDNDYLQTSEYLIRKRALEKHFGEIFNLR